MNLNILSIIISGIVGLGGIILTGINIYWSRKERVEPIKHQLYKQQLLASMDCVEKLVSLQIDIENHHSQIGYQEFIENEENRLGFINASKNSLQALKKALYKWAYILPSPVFFPITHYVSIVEYASGERQLLDGWAGASYPCEAPWTMLPRFFLETISSIREFLGIDPLSSQLIETIGSHANKELDEGRIEEKIKKETQALGYLMSNDYRPYGSYRHGCIIQPFYRESDSNEHDETDDN